MKLVKRTFLTTCICLLCYTQAFAQTKFEREYRVKPNEVPAKAIAFINWQTSYGKIRWYYEENFEANAYEGKLKINKQKYSIEFDTLGNLQDIEIELNVKRIDSPILDEIKQSLSEKFDRYKIVRLQQQFSGSVTSLSSFLQTPSPNDSYVVRYEMTIKGKKNGSRELYEVTFNSAGEVINVSTIVSRNTDNLEY